MLLPAAEVFEANPKPQTNASCPEAAPFVLLHVAFVGNPEAQLPGVVTAQLAVVVPVTRVQLAMVAWPAPTQVAVQVEPTVVPQLVAQLA